jgi:large subunit ribosomal protein L32
VPPQPKRKLSKARRDRRRAHDSLPAIHLVRCTQCGTLRRPHSACPDCGTYRGMTVIEIESQSKS